MSGKLFNCLRSSLAILINLMSKSVIDEVVEPDRAFLIPEFNEVKEISIKNGCIAVGISGSGPSIFSLSNTRISSTKILDGISKHYKKLNIDYDGFISKINSQGIKILDSK